MEGIGIELGGWDSLAELVELVDFGLDLFDLVVVDQLSDPIGLID